jgi:hypothetical protein
MLIDFGISPEAHSSEFSYDSETKSTGKLLIELIPFGIIRESVRLLGIWKI